MNDKKMICFLSALLLAWILLICGEPDLLDAITARIGGTELQSRDPCTIGLMKDFSRVQSELQTNLAGVHQIIASHNTNFNILVGVLQRHEQMLTRLEVTNTVGTNK